MKQLITPVLLGGAAGATLGFVVFKLFESKLDAKLRSGGEALLTEGQRTLQQEATRLIDEEVPPRVRAAVDAELRDFGLTPRTGRQIAQVLDYADRAGIV